MSASPKQFIFLLLEEHPYGREMLAQLLAAGHRPAAIIEESSPLAAVERDKFVERIAGYEVNLEVAAQVADHGIEHLSVALHDDRHCLQEIHRLAPDLIVLGGTGIVRGQMLDYPIDGVLNSHPGLLPECRGSASPAWSVWHDIPIGSSCHFCTAAIDEGDLVGRREVPVHRGDRYEDLCYRTLVMAGTLMVEALDGWSSGRLDDLRRPQGPSPYPTFRNMSDDGIESIRVKLAEQRYNHYTD